jgi:hypothetical protein
MQEPAAWNRNARSPNSDQPQRRSRCATTNCGFDERSNDKASSAENRTALVLPTGLLMQELEKLELEKFADLFESTSRNLEPDEISNRTSAAARSSGAARAGQTVRCSLFASCAGVHVDFHAHRHLDNLRSLPSHSGSSQLVWRDPHARAEPRAASCAAQVRNIDESAAPEGEFLSWTKSLRS